MIEISLQAMDNNAGGVSVVQAWQMRQQMGTRQSGCSWAGMTNPFPRCSYSP